jgi:hypothetical protein
LQVKQPEKKKALPPNAMPWQDEPPIATVGGFTLASGHIAITLGYALYKEAVLLHSHLHMPNSEPKLWRYHWTSYIEAERMAENLAAESEEYLRKFQLPIRPNEDLDFDDFIDHLHARLNNELH